MVQALVRIAQQYYITKRFYGHEGSLGRQAQAASSEAREMSKDDKKNNAKSAAKESTDLNEPFVSKRVTAPKISQTHHQLVARNLLEKIAVV